MATNPSFTKRQKERQRKEKQVEKAAKKAERRRERALRPDGAPADDETVAVLTEGAPAPVPEP